MSSTPFETLSRGEIVTAVAEYCALVRKLADGKEDPDLDEVQAVLAKVGKTVTSLNSDIREEIQRDRTPIELTGDEKLELAALRRERQELNEQRYVELINAEMDGFEVDIETCEAIAEATGRTLGDFVRDVRELSNLRQRRAEIDRQFKELFG